MHNLMDALWHTYTPNVLQRWRHLPCTQKVEANCRSSEPPRSQTHELPRLLIVLLGQSTELSSHASQFEQALSQQLVSRVAWNPGPVVASSSVPAAATHMVERPFVAHGRNLAATCFWLTMVSNKITASHRFVVIGATHDLRHSSCPHGEPVHTCASV